MKMLLKTARTAALGLAGLVCAAVATGPAAPLAAQEVADHTSVMHIDYDTVLPTTRRAKLGLNKSMIVELPRDLRDVAVSNPEVMDAVVQTSNRVYLIARKLGQSNAFFFDADGQRILTVEVAVERDVSLLEDTLNRLLDGASIDVEMLHETVILKGSVKRAVDASRAADIASRFAVGPDPSQNNRYAKKVINMLSVEDNQQVLLKVTVAEMNRETIKRFGVNWQNANFGESGFLGGTNNSFPISSRLNTTNVLTGIFGPEADRGACFISGSPASLSGVTAGVIQDPNAVTDDFNCLTKTVEAFERNGLLRMLAEPTLTAISGETANFLAGGEFPIPVDQEDGGTTIEWKEFGISLAFTPLVLSERRISMKLSTEVSELSEEGAIRSAGISIPSIETRRANTTVELPSGGSLVIAGLLSDDTRQNIDGVPGLNKLPVLGTLFRSRDFRKRETELVVIVTPLMVNPVARQQLARPDDNFMPATEAKATFLGHLNRVYGRKSNLPAGEYQGDVGFIVE